MAWTGNTVRHLQAANVIHEKKNIQSIVSKNQCGNCKSLILPPPRSSNLFFWRCFTCDHWLQSVQGSDIEYVSELKVSQKEKTYIIDYDELAYNAISMQYFGPGVLCSNYTVMAANVKVKFASDCQWVNLNLNMLGQT